MAWDSVPASAFDSLAFPQPAGTVGYMAESIQVEVIDRYCAYTGYSSSSGLLAARKPELVEPSLSRRYCMQSGLGTHRRHFCSFCSFSPSFH